MLSFVISGFSKLVIVFYEKFLFLSFFYRHVLMKYDDLECMGLHVLLFDPLYLVMSVNRVLNIVVLKLFLVVYDMVDLRSPLVSLLDRVGLPSSVLDRFHRRVSLDCNDLLSDEVLPVYFLVVSLFIDFLSYICQMKYMFLSGFVLGYVVFTYKNTHFYFD